MNVMEEKKVEGRLDKEMMKEKHFSLLDTIVSKFERLWFYLTFILAGMLIILLLLFYIFFNHSAETQKNYQRELRIQQMQNSLSAALIDANRNEYEVSRQTANDFFNSLEKELALSEESAFKDDQKVIMKEALKKKETINQLLSEKDPQAREELVKTLDAYQKTIKGFQPIQK